MSGFSGRSVCLLLVAVCAVLPAWSNVLSRRDVGDGVTAAPPDTADDGSQGTATPGDCKEVKYPCTRVYSVEKPVKQCISYLCVTSVRRVYMVNKEICTRVMCKEDEFVQDEKCRQLAGLPPRRLPPPEDEEAKEEN